MFVFFFRKHIVTGTFGRILMPSTVLSLSAAADPLLHQVDQLIKDSLATPVSPLRKWWITCRWPAVKNQAPSCPSFGKGFRRKGNSAKRRALVSVAAAVELIHTASLVHDDIIDCADRAARQATCTAAGIAGQPPGGIFCFPGPLT